MVAIPCRDMINELWVPVRFSFSLNAGRKIEIPTEATPITHKFIIKAAAITYHA